MLNQQRSGSLARLKYLVTIPICAALLCSSTLVFSKTYGWIDLSAANVRPPVNYAAVNKINTKKYKRLKITQNGVTTISDQLAVDQNNTKVVYTPATITPADRSSLLKSKHIKVEVVEDSTRLTTMDGKLILPVVNVDGYYLLDHFLHHNVRYTSSKGEKGGLVEIGFSLDADRHITDAKVVKSGGPKLDALALNGFNAYKGIVNDDAGKKYKIGVYFFTDDYSIFKTDSLGKDPEFAGELIITNYKYPVNYTSKGYEYEESNLGFPADGPTMTHARVIIYDKNGEASIFYKNKVTDDDLKMLRDKYGYTFPSSAYNALQMMHPKNVDNKRLAYIFGVSSYLDAPYSDHFYSHIVNSIAYPATEHKALVGGVVILNFELDSSGMITNVSVAQSGGKDFDEAALNAVQSYKVAVKDYAGKHSMAMVFCVAEKKYRPVVSDKFKTAGYVGELAVSDVRSPFQIGNDK